MTGLFGGENATDLRGLAHVHCDKSHGSVLKLRRTAMDCDDDFWLLRSDTQCVNEVAAHEPTPPVTRMRKGGHSCVLLLESITRLRSASNISAIMSSMEVFGRQPSFMPVRNNDMIGRI